MALDEELQIIITKDFEMDCFMKGYHVHRESWTPKTSETLSTKREPESSVDKYSACVKKDKMIKSLDFCHFGKFDFFASKWVWLLLKLYLSETRN